MANRSTERDIKKWLERSFDLDGANIDDAKSALIGSIVKSGFKLKQQDHSGTSSSVKAIYGSKLIAFLLGLLPFGKHFPSGKRFLLEASLSSKSGLHLNMRITPYMELFGAEEMSIVTQSLDEKASDEFLAAKLLHQVANRVFNSLRAPLPEDLSVFNAAEFAKDTLWGILIYPLDSYRARKPIYITSEPGPSWCWGGFIMPEIWFLWNEIWGVSILAGIPTAIYFSADLSVFQQNILLGFIIGIRIYLGLKGNKIYFAKYGRWPGKRQ